MADRTSSGPIAALCGVLALSAAALLIAWGSGSWQTSVSSGGPGAELRSLNALARDSWRRSFEATYTYTGLVPQRYGLTHSRPSTARFTIAQEGSKSRLAIAGTVAIDEGGQQAFVCDRRECLADSPMPRVETPPFFYELRNLANGNTFWADTQGYPITTADLASRGVALAFSTATYAGRSATCVTMTYQRDADGQTLTRGDYRTLRWCVDRDGIVDAWWSGHSSFVLTSYTRHPPASAFMPPPGDSVGIPK